MKTGHPARSVRSSPDAMHRHRPVTAAFELFLARRLQFYRMLPAERLRNLYGLARRVSPRAAVKSERTAGVGDVHDDLLLFNSSCGGCGHLRVNGRLGARPDLEYAVVAHAAHGVMRLHRSVREVGKFVESVYGVLRIRQPRRDVSGV